MAAKKKASRKKKATRKKRARAQLKDPRWGLYDIFDVDGTKINKKPVRGVSDQQALGNWFRGKSKVWAEGVTARRIRNLYPRSEEAHQRAEHNAEAQQAAEEAQLPLFPKEE